MAERNYRVFLSAVSLDLKSFRRDAATVLNDHAGRICPHGPLVVDFQEEFPPDYRDVWSILRQRISACDAVICLIGFAFGREPRNRPVGMARRSYTADGIRHRQDARQAIVPLSRGQAGGP